MDPPSLATNMTKKTTSTSNVPSSSITTNKVGNKGHHSSKSNSNSPQKNHLQSNNNGAILNSKHLHNQSNNKIPLKTKQPSHSESAGKDISNKSSGGTTDDSSGLMKKLFEAVQKQKESEKPTNSMQRTRKSTAPLPKIAAKPINSSENYAGAAFDRAPAATSFPIPSFIKSNSRTTVDDNTVSNFSTSCPLPSSPNLKTLSMSELFKSSDHQQTHQQSPQKNLENLTNDLRKILNLR